MVDTLPFVPDWQNSIRETLGFKTEVITSRNQEEQRIALRPRYRRTVEFDMKLSGGNLQRWLGWVSKNHQGEFWFIDQTRWMELSGNVLMGATELNFTKAPRWATEGSSIFLWTGSEHKRYGVSTITETKIVLDTPLLEAWPDRTRVYASIRFRLDQSIRGRMLTNSAGTIKVKLDQIPGSEKPKTSPPTSAFNYHELFLTKHNWRDPVDLNLSGNLEIVDYDRGVNGFHSFTDINVREEKLAFLGRDPSNTDSFIQFFERCKGRQRPFFMPTWENDLAGATGSGTVLTIPSSNFEELYGGSDIYRAIFVVYKDGSTFPVLIKSVIQNFASDTEITLADPLPQPVNGNSVTMVCLLPLWRFSSDSITIEHRTNTVAQWTAPMSTLPNSSGWPGGYHVPSEQSGGQNLWLRQEFYNNSIIDLLSMGLDPSAAMLTLGGSFLGATRTPDGVTSNGIVKLTFEFYDAADVLLGSSTNQVDSDFGSARAIIPPTSLPSSTAYIKIIDEAIPDNGSDVGIGLEIRIQLGERV